MQCMSVDLPDPEGPITAVNRPVWKLTETPANAWTWAWPVAVGFDQVDRLRRRRPVVCGSSASLTAVATPTQSVPEEGCFF